MSRVLIVSGRGDWSAGQVATQLQKRECAYSWFDPADFPQQVQVTANLGHGWRGEVQTPDGAFFWEEISAVFYRRPRDFIMPSAMSGPEQRFSRAQARVGLGGVLASLPAKWINHPSALADCEYKPRQLSLARTVGLHVPATIITNVPEEVRRFGAEQGDIIVKSLAEPIIAEAGSHKAVWTRQVAATELTDLTGLELTAHLFQKQIPKAYEIRLTVVGKRDFAVAIHAHSAATRIDWRTDYDALTYEVIECPSEVAERAHVPGLQLGYDTGPAQSVDPTDATSIIVHTTDAVANVSLDPAEDGRWPVTQRGPRRIWDTIETAIALWDHLHQPDICRLGVSALDDINRQYVWLDDPNGPYSWPMPL